jgi:hypothetical protein
VTEKGTVDLGFTVQLKATRAVKFIKAVGFAGFA